MTIEPAASGAQPSTSPRPLVAVVTPVYNGARFLAETMASVQAQTYAPLVHVVLDNASTDATPDIIRRFEGGRVPVIAGRRTTTVPMADNWNEALRLVPAEAGWFRLLCADDLIVPAAIETMMAPALADPEVGVVGCYWAAEGLCGSELPKDRTSYAGSEIVRLYLLRETMVLSGMFGLIRCDLARACEPFYDGSLVSFDSDATLKVLRCSDFALVHEELGTWRRHADSTTDRLACAALTFKSEWLVLLDRYGPGVMKEEDYRGARLAFQNHYLRKLLQLFVSGRRDLFWRFLADLEARGDPASPSKFVVALWDWLKRASSGRRDRVGRLVPDA